MKPRMKPRNYLEATLRFTPELDRFVKDAKLAVAKLAVSKPTSKKLDILQHAIQLTPKQLEIYKLIKNHPGITQKGIAGILNISTSRISQMISCRSDVFKYKKQKCRQSRSYYV